MSDKDYILQVKNLTKYYGKNIIMAKNMLKKKQDKQEILKKAGVAIAVNDVSFNVERGKIFVIIGLSGSGKSTIARCINMLQKPTSGEILFDGTDVCKYDKHALKEFRRSKVSMVFQGFGLMSHMTVIENVAFGLDIKGLEKNERREKAMEHLEMVSLTGWEDYNISALSGGMRQRVGLARALCNNPDLLLMDEPFSALDPIVRKEMQFELMSIQKKLGKTIVFITHDINEAFKLGDTVAIMKDGVIEQIDTPENMTMYPANPYVSEFIDSADKSQVYTAKNIMAIPLCLVKLSDGVNVAIKQMRENNVSSAYVVDNYMGFIGMVSIEDAIAGRNANSALKDILSHDCESVLDHTPLSDIINIAVGTRYPLAVLDDSNRLKGIITKAAILGVMAPESGIPQD